MHISEVILDGFKSYANRTVISAFDPGFNAITGLNGTGKSNILDAICFVLGISNLSAVRVGNLQELVYKQGQARVQRATVTLQFNNEDKSTSPVGYEHMSSFTVSRQVVVGGRNKYQINGCTAQLSRIVNLFHSVGLNVNNPHFLIMQGKITKVVNMKPLELLSLLEEAAGTRMFEAKKAVALRTIEKKEQKVTEINRLLQEEINPTLDKLREERKDLVEYEEIKSRHAKLTRKHIAHQVHTTRQKVAKHKQQEAELQQEISDTRDRFRTANQQIEELQREIEQQTKIKLQQESSGTLQPLEDAASACTKSIVKLETQVKNLNAEIAQEEKNQAQFKQSMQQSSAAIRQNESQQSAAQQKLETATQSYNDCKQRLSELESAALGIETAQSGTQKDAAGGGLHGQLMSQQKAVQKFDSAIATLQLALQKFVAQSKAKSKQLAAAEKANSKSENKLAEAQQAVEAIQSQVRAFKAHRNANCKSQSENANPESQSMDQLQAQLQQCEDTIVSLSSESSRLSHQLHRLDLDYVSPSPSFDRRSVKGIVAKLISVRDESSCRALEVCAGGKLFNVVCDTESTGRELLQKGQLKRRITILPLNKMAARCIDTMTVKKAQELVGASNVSTALSLVGYDAQLESAMQYVFGSSFVCSDAATAAKVTFHPSIRIRSVTLDGDVSDPSGVMEGGAKQANASVLQQLFNLNRVQTKLQSLNQTRKQLREEMASAHKQEKELAALEQRQDLLQHELALLQQTNEQSQHSQLNAECNQLKQEIASTESQLTSAQSAQLAAKQRCAELESSIQSAAAEKNSSNQNIEREMKSTTQKLNKLHSQQQSAAKDQERHALALAQMQAEQDALKSQLKTSQDHCETIQESIRELEKQNVQAQAEFKVASLALDDEKSRITQCDTMIHQLSSRRSKLENTMNQIELEVKKLANKLNRLQADQTDDAQRLAMQEEQHAWIAQEQHLFGVVGSDYDFAHYDAAVSHKTIGALAQQCDELSKRLNSAVLLLFSSAEASYNDLMSKKRIIESDKAKIVGVITDLEDRKNAALHATHKRVNRDFGEIMASLLPGVQAQLHPSEQGKTILEGVEMRVAFNGVWKDSLTELSGGQRSLLALSLILALLLFKPAPMYILDEIDAALDLSHTQNIGRMLKKHFPNSQFIVVSLKEGMFNNANVIYRTKFVQGVSAVTRTQIKQ